MKNGISTKAFAFLAFALFASLSFASSVSAGSALIKTVPESSWIPGNTYRVDIYADNTGLDGDATKGISWQLSAPSQLAPYMTITQGFWPSSADDFFHGSSSIWKLIGANWNPHGKLVSSGYSNNQGIVGSYYVHLATNAPHGQYSFNINRANTDFTSQSNAHQPFVVENVPFIVPITTQASGVAKLGTAGFNSIGNSGESQGCLEPGQC